MHLLLQLAEWSRVSALVLFKELKDFLDAFRGELLADAVEVLSLILPELNLSGGEWVVLALQVVLRILLQYVFNLFLPMDDCGCTQI